MNDLTYQELEDFIKKTACEYNYTKPNIGDFYNVPIRLFYVVIRQGSDMLIMILDFAYNNENETFKAIVKLNTLSVGVEILNFINENSRTF